MIATVSYYYRGGISYLDLKTIPLDEVYFLYTKLVEIKKEENK